MVYFFGDWGMGDTKCTTCKHVSKLSSNTDEEDNNKLTSTVSKAIPCNPSDNRQLTSSTTTSLISVSSSSSSSLSSLTSLALNSKINKKQQNQLLPISTKDQFNHTTELIRQRSSSLQHDDRHKLCQQQSENDDEVAVHPLTNQVNAFLFGK